MTWSNPPLRFLKADPPGQSPAASGELQVRIRCRGRRAEVVLADLDRGLLEAEAQGRDPLVVLEDLGLLADSVMTLIKGISRRLDGYPRTVNFWEATGFTEAFISVVDGPELP